MRKNCFIGIMLCLFFMSLATSDYWLPINTGLVSKAAQQSMLRIKQRNPVVNEGNRIKLSVVDSQGNPVINGVSWQSGSPDVASVDLTTGEIIGLKSGFATITAMFNGESSSVFLTVSKVRKTNGSKIPGDTKADSQGSVYISSPAQNIILKAENTTNSSVKIFAGTAKVAGNRNGLAKEALFAGPTAIGIDNSVNGGLYIADTLNHNIRKIGFDQQVKTILGKNAPGTSIFSFDGRTDLEKLVLNSPRGVITDNGGNFYVADTDNHSIYYVDVVKKRVNIIAGEPGQSGKEDGLGRNAKFKRPSGMALSTDGRLLTVADEDNNRVRLIELSRNDNGDLIGNVSTLSVTSQSLANNSSRKEDNELVFDKPQSISVDGLGNIYVVDNKSVRLITRPVGQPSQIIELAEPNVTFNKAVSVTIKGTEAFVLDTNSTESETLKVVSVGAPEILSIDPPVVNIGQTTELVIKGKNFAPDSQIVFGGKQLQFNSIKAEEIRVELPVQSLPGRITLSVLTRGGLVQREINSISKPANLLMAGEITTIAGGAIFLGNGGSADLGNLGSPVETVIDSFGNLFISDRNTRTIRRVDAQTNIITTVAGGGDFLSNGILATTALIRPSSITVNKAGDLFIVDAGSVIRKIDMFTGLITTFAGGFGRFPGGDGGLAINAGFNAISDIAFDPKGNLLVLESNTLRLIDANTGLIRKIAGTGLSEFSGDKGPALNASFVFANSLAVDAKGNVFISDFSTNRIRSINKKGIIDTVVGDGLKQENTTPEMRNGKKATKVSLFAPTNITVDSQGNLFIQDKGSPNSFKTILSKVALKTEIITTQKINGRESDNQLVVIKDSKINSDGVGNIFFTSEAFNVFKLNTKSEIATKVAGNTKFNFSGDNGLASFAALGDISDIVTDSLGNIYIADFINGRIRRINSNTNIIDSFVGKDNGNTLNGNQTLSAETVSIFPKALAVRNNKLLIVEDQNNNLFIHELDLNKNIISTIAGNGTGTISDGGLATQTRFNAINALATDGEGNIYLLDGTRLRKIDSQTKIVNTVIDVGFGELSPNGLAIDKNGNIFISFFGSFVGGADRGGGVLHFDVQTKKLSLFAGGNKSLFQGDNGLAANASLGFVESISLDVSGNLFIGAYTFSERTVEVLRKIPRIWKVDKQSKTIKALIKSDEGLYNGDGNSISSASLGDCSKIYLDEKNQLFIVNRDNKIQSIRLVK